MSDNTWSSSSSSINWSLCKGEQHDSPEKVGKPDDGIFRHPDRDSRERKTPQSRKQAGTDGERTPHSGGSQNIFDEDIRMDPAPPLENRAQPPDTLNPANTAPTVPTGAAPPNTNNAGQEGGALDRPRPPQPQPPFTLPTPGTFAGAEPIGTSTNPHFATQPAQQAPPNKKDGKPACQRNPGSWPEVILDLENLMAHIDPVQREAIERDETGQNMLVVTSLGGDMYNRLMESAANAALVIDAGDRDATLTDKIANVLQAVSEADNPIRVWLPQSNGTPARGDKYHGASILVAEVPTASQRNKIKKQRTFACTSTLAFHVVQASECRESWVVGEWQTGRQEEPEHQKACIRGGLFREITQSKDLMQDIDAMTQAREGSLPLRATYFLGSLHAVVTPHVKDPLITVYLSPFGGGTSQQRAAFLSKLRAVKFSFDVYHFKPMRKSGEVPNCPICKLATFWWGPTQTLGEHTEGPLALNKRGRSERGRGGRGGAPRGRYVNRGSRGGYNSRR
ncbi:hypothetical protein MIND_00868700 [Mycena indigotica]|uniref:Uncharacterized protein n=1 Tax=Mycena indigotica TaxID=2126181 RepID=A0A8H6W247_9AGAR|nr:uncharacterized protein MIND_00835800 [Mycena indigotica]XP_037218588.1 uncharacterized protein MIND_00868700 [Mycena indigotica]KAF7298878.1 hypothetical protein MIND_00835800 [Mycena indigotica]KAF7299200.1 hypothetical protein MIND_00868700 [Mycena indigotica]